MRTLLILFLFLFLCGQSRPQVIVNSHLTPTTIRIGEQAQLSVAVTMDTGERAYFPEFKGNMITKDVEVVDAGTIDTTFLNENKRIKLTRTYRITSFEQALYTLPPFEVRVGGKIYKAKEALGLKVDTAGINVDTLHVDRFYGPKSTVESLFEWNSSYFWLSVLALLCFLGAAILAVRYFNQRPITRRIILKPAEQPHKWAMREITKIREERSWTTDDAKDYYVRLTDILRHYIEQRFHFSAKEMTTAEIMEKLLKAKDENTLRELRQILETADLVKFAKYKVDLNENDANLMKAIEFINETKIETELPIDPVVKEVILKENRQMFLRIAMALGVFLLMAITLGTVVYICIGLSRSFF